jgi:hypothetical protein
MSVLSGEGQGHKYIPPKKAQLKLSRDLEIFNERIKRVTAAYTKIHLDYNPISYPERYQLAQEKVNLHLQQEHEKYVVKKLLGLTRVKIHSGQFEDSEGIIDNSVKSALVYKIQVDIEREEAVKAGSHGDLMHQCLFVLGRYDAPLPRYSFNDKHEITGSRVVGSIRRYFIKDTPQNIRDIIKRYGDPQKVHPYTVAVAHPSGSMYYVDNRTYTVHEYDDFVNTPIDVLIEANKAGFLEAGKQDRIKLFEQYTKRRDEKRKEGDNLSAKKFLKDLDAADVEE